MPPVLRLAFRELRGGLKGFRILMACLALGVAAISASGSLKAAFQRTLQEDSRALLGGDIDLRQSSTPPTPEQRTFFDTLGIVSEGTELRAMARTPQDRRLVEVKGVDDRYPLVGTLELSPSLPLSQALSRQDGIWGAVVEPRLLEVLSLKVGDNLAVGDATFQIRAVIEKEPDRLSGTLSLGPRVMISNTASKETGLLRPGSLNRWAYHIALPPGGDVQEARSLLSARFPEAEWQIRDSSAPAPTMGRILDSIGMFLTLVGLTALLVGGIGVANAVKAYMESRTHSIAILKSLGAPTSLILTVYAGLVGALALVGIFLGVAVGGLIPWIVTQVAGNSLPVAARLGIYPGPLALAAGFGILTTVVFSLWPLARAKAVPAATLFRQSAIPLGAPPGRGVLLLTLVLAILLGGLTVLTTDRPLFALAFVLSAIATLGLFRGLAWLISRTAAMASAHRRGWLASPTGRLALANLHRPGASTVSVVLSLGLGLTVLVTMALVESNLALQFGTRLPQQAPSFFFIDIQPDQFSAFERAIRTVDGKANIEQAPSVRGRMSSINGHPSSAMKVSEDVAWAARGDRHFTALAAPPKGSRILEGTWWDKDYSGPPLVSVEASVAKGFGMKIGDTLGLNILGRDISVQIASIREVEWLSLEINFAFVLSPHALDGAPHTWIATVHAAPENETNIERSVTSTLVNVSAIRIKETLTTVRQMIGHADLALRLATLVTLTAGALVLAGAALAGHRRRVREAVILKVLGATRADLWRAWLLEFGVIGLSTGLCSAGIGGLAAWAILVRLKADWVFLPGVIAATVLTCVVASLLAGFAGIYAAMRAKAGPVLRAE